MQGRGKRDSTSADVESQGRRSPSLSPRKGNQSSSAFRDRPESASLLPESASQSSSAPRRPPTFDGVSVVAVPLGSSSTAADDDGYSTPSKRLRWNSNGESTSKNKRLLSPPPWAGGALHLTTAVVGVGILGLPRALVDLGWYCGIAFMALATAVSLYTALLLVELCSESEGEDGRNSSAAAAGGNSRSPAPAPAPPEASRLLPPNGSSSGVVTGRRGSNQDLQHFVEAERNKKNKKKTSEAGGGERAATAATATTAVRLSSSPSSSGGSSSNGYLTYGSLARGTLGPRLGAAVSTMQLLACAG